MIMITSSLSWQRLRASTFRLCVTIRATVSVTSIEKSIFDLFHLDSYSVVLVLLFIYFFRMY